MARNRATSTGESSRKEGGPKRASKAGNKSESSKPRSRKRKHRSERRGEEEEEEDDDDDNNGEEIDIVPRRAKPSKKGRYGRTAGKNYPPQVKKQLGTANALYVQNKVNEALDVLSEVIRTCPQIPEPYALLGLIYLDGGNLENALMFYKLACTRDAKNIYYHEQGVRIARDLGDQLSLLQLLQTLARLRPTDLSVAIDKATCLVELDKPKQALDAYAKAAKRFPRKLGIYLELAESVESVVLSPPQHIMVYQALASCLRRAMGKRFLGPDVRDLADAFAARLREYKLDGSKPKRLPPRRRGLPSRSVYEAATKATDLLVAKLMESRKRQEPQYEVAVQVVEGLVAWLDVCRRMAARIAATGGGEGEYADEEDEENGEEELDSDSDLRDSDEESAEEEASESDGADRSDDDGGYDDNDDSEDDEPMCRFVVERTTLVRYGICQLYCGEKGKASQAFAFLCNENADGEYGDRMLEIAKVYGETDNVAESVLFLRQVARSMHPRRHLAGVQLGAAYAAQGKHELASDIYSAVIEGCPQHAAALAGLAEAAYWRGKGAAPKALSELNRAIEKFTRTWAGEQPQPPVEDDDEGEEAYGFQRLQLLIQWATLSRMTGNAANFASVALPLVSVALGQMDQRAKFDMEQTVAAHAPHAAKGRERRGTGPDGEVNEPGSKQQDNMADEGLQGEEGEASDKDGSTMLRDVQWRPTSSPLLLPRRRWQAGLPGKISTLALQLSGTMDVVGRVGRRAIFWHVIELIRSLRELGFPKDVEVIASAALSQTGFLRSVEREDLQVVAGRDNLVVLRSMPDGCPIVGPASRQGILMGPVRGANPAPESGGDTVFAAPTEQYFTPPWRCVEERYDANMPQRGGNGWRSGTRSSAGPRRSRSRALMELAERKKEGDAICTIVLALSRTPGNDAMWNLLQRVASERGVDAGDGGFHGEQVEALVGRHREQAQGLIYRGHDAAMWSRAKQALKLYGQAHALRPAEPLPLLCLGTHIMRMVTIMETMVENDGVCVLQALACLHRYAELRKSHPTNVVGGITGSSSSLSASAVPEAVLEQEILYNLGRGYHQVGLDELAMEYYNRALRVEDERGAELRNWHGGNGVTKETAHNLCTLYKRCGSTAMALGIMHKFLAVG